MENKGELIKIEKVINDIASNDKELYYRLVDRLSNNIYSIIREEKEQICKERDYHDFSEWKESRGVIAHYSDDLYETFGEEITYENNGKFYQRYCLYCGITERSYSESERDRLTKENETKRNKSYVLKNNDIQL